MELPENSSVDEVQIFRRTNCCEWRNRQFYVSLLNDGETIAQFYQESETIEDVLIVSFC